MMDHYYGIIFFGSDDVKEIKEELQSSKVTNH
jgi:hypothetical protein